ncbi:GMC family oxidoreductase [Pseudonocardia spinosispora]|uniref:GMC family oxidoreductase n=1 Tax=Pseudonocardia spinosispora TaxID=103441 RepID=UPI0006862D56|nr:GMC family oxidoreductase N-terminal domain-containing protein [Pseudonocardia spinosispora]
MTIACEELSRSYDVIVCGAGSSGSVVAARLSAHPDVRVLLLEAGPTDDAATVDDPLRWPENLGSERDWGFAAEPDPALNGRALPLSMGKGLGGGSSVNVLAWVRGHRSDWDYLATVTGDQRWSYEAVLQLYRERIEDWHGVADPGYRGAGGPMYVSPPRDPHPIAHALCAAATSIGLETVDSINGAAAERAAGVAALTDTIIRDGPRQSVYRGYVTPVRDRPNLTVRTAATVERLVVRAGRVTGVVVRIDGVEREVRASYEVVVSLGAIATPALLMRSGIGDADLLTRLGVSVVADLPAVGRNYQDHIAFSCVWEAAVPLRPRNNIGESMFLARSDDSLDSPDLLGFLPEAPLTTPGNATRFGLPEHAWSIFIGLSRPASRGRIEISGTAAADPPRIMSGALADPADLRTARAAVRLARDIGNSEALRTFRRREVMPGSLAGAGLDTFLRDAASTFWHQSGTAAMGIDPAVSVVDPSLAVHGVQGLRVADASVLTRITTGNTMAPCVVIGERAAQSANDAHGFRRG